MRLPCWRRPHNGQPKADPEAAMKRLQETKNDRLAVIHLALALRRAREHNHFSESLSYIYRGGTSS